MGNASDEVKRRASFTTTSFEEEGFANAVESIILPRAVPASGPASKPTGRLHHVGQSLWLDNITRELVEGGTLERYIRELSVTGLTSNPTIFEHAIETSPAYDASIIQRAQRGMTPEEAFFEIALEDITRAADLFRPIHDRTAGIDGWVSLEVSPLLARDPTETLAAAKSLFARASRPNLMIKIPGTRECLPAIEEAIFQGIPINVTLLFSREQYLAAAEAFLRGTERRIEAGLSPNVSSVASIFVSRWDTAIAQTAPVELKWRLGIAMAKRTYKAYRDLLRAPRWQRVYNAGGRPQRLLWASTGTKDPAGSDVMYVKALTAQFTVVTVPEKTLLALGDHGDITSLLRADGGDCEQGLAAFTAAGIDLYALAERLQEEGTESFVHSWNGLMEVIASKAAALSRERARGVSGPGGGRPVRVPRRDTGGGGWAIRGRSPRALRSR
ncbi:MAG: transaldolase [Polyangiaceae bacterium]|nr:transaldolase [Polyangiaceae bacterium]